MSHTRTCENATNRECYCDCKGSMHGRNPRGGTIETKEGYREKTDEEKIEKAWNDANFSTRKFTVGPVTGVITDGDEADFASRSSWDELSSETRAALLRHPELTKRGLKGS